MGALPVQYVHWRKESITDAPGFGKVALGIEGFRLRARGSTLPFRDEGLPPC